jgi:hypothetical protein
MSEELARAVDIHLVYRDDASNARPPEKVPGQVPLVGYEGRHVEDLPTGRYRFQLSIFGLSGYRRGDERPILENVDHPLTADVTAEFPPPPASAARPAS